MLDMTLLRRRLEELEAGKKQIEAQYHQQLGAIYAIEQLIRDAEAQAQGQPPDPEEEAAGLAPQP